MSHPQLNTVLDTRNYDNDLFIFNKHDWLRRSFVLNDRAERMEHLEDGIHVVRDESGRAMAAWDDVGHFGCVSQDTLSCPIGSELDDQLIAAELHAI